MFSAANDTPDDWQQFLHPLRPTDNVDLRLTIDATRLSADRRGITARAVAVELVLLLAADTPDDDFSLPIQLFDVANVPLLSADAALRRIGSEARYASTLDRSMPIGPWRISISNDALAILPASFLSDERPRRLRTGVVADLIVFLTYSRFTE
jgi:hypothetical protein